MPQFETTSGLSEQAIDSTRSGRRQRLPSWLRVQLPAGVGQGIFNRTQSTVDQNTLHTVCEEARCPNLHDCWARGTATFMIAGKECTRGCRFCSVATNRNPQPPDPAEPEHVAAAVARMGLEHVVITVVNRDDLSDGGAGHIRRCLAAIHARAPGVSMELLSGDLAGDKASLEALLDGTPLMVFAHNVECVERLDREVRDPRASFHQSLTVLQRAKQFRPDVFTKSSLMVGLGETDDEVRQTIRQLRAMDVDMLTIGQYLTPAYAKGRFLPVARYVHPDQFESWKNEALTAGFLAVASGPLVRSSFRAGKLLDLARKMRHQDTPSYQ
ncbi:MAG: lipoyl synthase [Pirellulales bacterium]|nr:lipoyl synthase [Pirellulales bacterium]